MGEGGVVTDGAVTADPVNVHAVQVRDRVTVAYAVALLGERAFTGAGSSVCDRHDEPDTDLGIQFAVGRALTELGKQMTRDAWRRCRGR